MQELIDIPLDQPFSMASVYVVIRCSKCNAPYGETYYYAVSYEDAQEFVDRETANSRLQGVRYWWRIVSAESV